MSAAVAALAAACVPWPCSGTVALIQEGKQINPRNEKYSVSIAVDIAKKTLTIDGLEGVRQWPINGDTSGSVIVSMVMDQGSANLNRITGEISIRNITIEGLEVFRGVCKPAQKLF